MIMQIFHIKLSLEATKNIFINSLEEPAFRFGGGGGGLLRYEKGCWDYITFNHLWGGKGQKTLI